MNTTTTTTAEFILEQKRITDENGNPSIPSYYVAPAPESEGDRIVAGPFSSYGEAAEELEKTWQ